MGMLADLENALWTCPCHPSVGPRSIATVGPDAITLLASCSMTSADKHTAQAIGRQPTPVMVSAFTQAVMIQQIPRIY
jgi:hypothetical protein